MEGEGIKGRVEDWGSLTRMCDKKTSSALIWCVLVAGAGARAVIAYWSHVLRVPVPRAHISMLLRAPLSLFSPRRFARLLPLTRPFPEQCHTGFIRTRHFTQLA